MSYVTHAARSGLLTPGFQYITIHIVAEEGRAKQIPHYHGSSGIAYQVYYHELQRYINLLLGKRDDPVFQYLEIVVHQGVPELAVHLHAGALCYGYDANAIGDGDAHPPTVQVRLTAETPCVLSRDSTICDIPIWEWNEPVVPGTSDQDRGDCHCKTRHKVIIAGFNRFRPSYEAVPDPFLIAPPRRGRQAQPSSAAPLLHQFAKKSRASVAFSIATQVTAAPATHAPQPAASALHYEASSYQGSVATVTRVAVEDAATLSISEEPLDAIPDTPPATTAVDEEALVQSTSALSAASAMPSAGPAFINFSRSGRPISQNSAQSLSPLQTPLQTPKKTAWETTTPGSSPPHQELPSSTAVSASSSPRSSLTSLARSMASSATIPAVTDEKPQMCNASTQTPAETTNTSTHTCTPSPQVSPQPVFVILPILFPFTAPSAQPSPAYTPGSALITKPAIKPVHTTVSLSSVSISETDSVPDPPEVDLSEFEMGLL